MRDYMRQRRAQHHERTGQRLDKPSSHTITCAQCGLQAQVGKATARYCSHACYYDARFGTDRPRDAYTGLSKAEQDAVRYAGKRKDPQAEARIRRRRRAARRLEQAAFGTRGSGVFSAGTCVRCGGAFVRRCTTSTGHCSDRCRRRDAASLRRAASRPLVAAGVSRWRLFDRDGWLCHICGDPVDREAQVPDPAAPTLDHVVPLARGGAHSEANLKTAHFLCNSRKGDLVEGWSLIAG